MRGARRAHVHQVDVAPRDDADVRVVDVRYPELLSEHLGALDHGIGDGDDLAPRVALVSRQVRKLGPRTAAKHADAYAFARQDRASGGHSITAPVSPGNNSWRCAQIGAMPLDITSSSNSRSENLAPTRF